MTLSAMGKFIPKFLTFKGKYNFKKQISLSKVTLQLSQLLVGWSIHSEEYGRGEKDFALEAAEVQL